MPEYGKLFVFEGPDDVGKTTLSRAFAEYLNRSGAECEHLTFPGQESGTLGKLVYDLHHNPRTLEVESVSPTSLQLLHIAAHLDAIESKILPALRTGRSVVLDRFWWSTWVYGKVSGANRQILKRMIEMERIFWEGVRPTMVFLIQREAPFGDQLTQHWRRVSAEYTKLAARESGRYPVLCMENDGTIDETLSEIVEVYKQSSDTNESETNPSQSYQAQLPLYSDQSVTSAPLVFSKLTPAKPTVVYDTYWQFAVERQAIFFRRLFGDAPPWTEDRVLVEYKFTNAYRVLDRVSQYLIKNVIYKGDQSPEEIFFRILLFKFFNRIGTWELLTNELGEISFANYSFERYDEILSKAISNAARIYSAAYIMPSGGPSSIYDKKHRMHLKLIEQMMQDEVPARIAAAPSMRKAFELLRSYPTIGDFLAYQYVTDLNYSNLINFSEMEFVVPGPGARDGLRKCFRDFGGLNEIEIIKIVADRQQAEFDRLGLEFQSLWGRPLQLIDCQNLFCEVDKYARVKHPDISGITGRTRIKQKYRINQDSISLWFPPKWGLNELIAYEDNYVSSISRSNSR